MFNYATDLSRVDIDPSLNIEFKVKGHDMQSLLYNYLEEFLFKFCSDYFCCKKATILSFDRENFEILVKG